MASISESDDGVPRAKRRRSDGGASNSDNDVSIPMATYDGCTRWRQNERAGRQEAPLAAHCAEAASDAKCACGFVICQRCKAAQEVNYDVWQSCNACENVYACSRCLDPDDCVLRSCEGGCDEKFCNECWSSCEACSKKLCASCGTGFDGNRYCEDCYADMEERNEEYAEEQRALQSEVLGSNYYQ